MVAGQIVSWGGFLAYVFDIPSPMQGKSAHGLFAFMTSTPAVLGLCAVGIFVTGPLLWTSGWWWPWVIRTFKRQHLLQVDRPTEQEERVFTLRTSKELLDEFNGRTDMEAQRVLQAHIGKWIVIEDKVKDISEESQQRIIDSLAKSLCRSN